MSVVSLNSNIASLRAQKRLAESTQRTSTTLERLSSGLRINRASDDAAGLAIASSLNADARIFTQAIRNVDDGLSLLNIAEGALQQLSTIATRQKELAEQAANGTYSRTQRLAMDAEANALVSEWNRITEATQFNGITLFNRTRSDTSIQVGVGASASISTPIGAELDRTVGDGTFATFVSYSAGGINTGVATADLNGDGFSDLVLAPGTATTAVKVLLGNGDGSFKAAVTYVTGAGLSGGLSSSALLSDFNRDGKVDLMTTDGDDRTLSVLLGNGDGSFKARTSMYIAATTFEHLAQGDLNGDGLTDVVFASANSGLTNVLLGNGDGTFRYGISFNVSAFGTALGDFNSDGVLDAVITTQLVGNQVKLGNGDGTFRNSVSFSGPISYDVQTADFNHDGIMDFATADYAAGTATTLSVYLSRGDGTFQPMVSYTTNTGPFSLTVADMDGDGNVDLLSGHNATVTLLLANGDGSFKAGTTFAAASIFGLTTADFNGDGGIDVAAVRGTEYARVLLANTKNVTTIARLDLTAQAEARNALTTIGNALDRVNLELGKLGSYGSRFRSALNTLHSSRENYKAAESRIVDADIAAESAELLRNQILQQAAAPVLAQANQQPALALRLLT